jgi:hypothetical protein
MALARRGLRAYYSPAGYGLPGLVDGPRDATEVRFFIAITAESGLSSAFAAFIAAGY